jgi:sugar lactone lactonase YvrE
VFDEDGTFILEFGGTGIAKPAPGSAKTWTPGNLNYPVDVAVDDEGLVYVADFYNDSVSVFSADGEFLRRFPDPNVPTGKGSSGRGGRGIAVTAIDVADERVYATDGYQVLVFALDGQLIRQFGRPGSAPGELDRPSGVVVSADGVIYVSDSNNNRLIAYTDEDEPLWTLGDRLPPSTVPSGPDEVILPRGLTLMDGKSLLVADPIGQQLAEVSLEGEALAFFGRRGADPGELNFPNDVDWHDGRIAIADKENSRVQIVRLVGR